MMKIRKKRSLGISRNNPNYSRDYNRVYRKTLRGKVAQAKANRKLTCDRYGITIDEYKKLFSVPFCRICGNKRTEKHRLHIDHCHETDKIRGILCKGCNQGLGKFKDNPELLKKAVAYLTTEHRYATVENKQGGENQCQ